METDFDEGILGDVDAISGWGAADFDDKLLDQSQRRDSQVAGEIVTKQKIQKTLFKSNSKSASGIATWKTPQQQTHEPISSLRKLIERKSETQVQQTEVSSKKNSQVQQILKRNQSKKSSCPKASPRIISLYNGSADIAAIGRQRRMRIVAAALAANVPRQSSVGSVVLASFEVDSDEDLDELEPMRGRRPDEWLPSSAPGDQLLLPSVAEPSTAPAGPVKVPKKIHPPLPLPLLSIKSDCGGCETRLLGKREPASEALRYRRRYQQKKPSLLPTRDVSDHWASNFPPAFRHLQSPRKSQAEVLRGNSNNMSSFARAVQVPPAPRQEPVPSLRAKEYLPSIKPIRKDSDSIAVLDGVLRSPRSTTKVDQVTRSDGDKGGDNDEEGWEHCYDDPEVLANSMAGLIQALSAFAADGKRTKASKSKKRRAKHRHKACQQQEVSPDPPLLRFPRLGEISFISSQTPVDEMKKEPELSSGRKRKHRRIRNKQSSDETAYEAFVQVP